QGSAGLLHGLEVTAGDSTIRGLVLGGFDGSEAAVVLSARGNNRIEGNIIGLGPDGLLNMGSTVGVPVLAGSDGNRIGGDDLADGVQDGVVACRNLISSNGSGVWIEADRTVVAGNLIGLDRTGTLPLGNIDFGVFVSGAFARIGGVTPGA